MLNLTREEKVVLIFLAACLLAGSSINHYKKSLPIEIKEADPKIAKKININTATLTELIEVKGIGVKTAERIIDYRQRNGRFFFKEDLMKIKGIGRAKFDSLKNSITTNE